MFSSISFHSERYRLIVDVGSNCGSATSIYDTQTELIEILAAIRSAASFNKFHFMFIFFVHRKLIVLLSNYLFVNSLLFVVSPMPFIFVILQMFFFSSCIRGIVQHLPNSQCIEGKAFNCRTTYAYLAKKKITQILTLLLNKYIMNRQLDSSDSLTAKLGYLPIIFGWIIMKAIVRNTNSADRYFLRFPEKHFNFHNRNFVVHIGSVWSSYWLKGLL